LTICSSGPLLWTLKRLSEIHYILIDKSIPAII
jgi:hypothetical protein